MIALCVLWFFSVSVFETVPRYDGKGMHEVYAGGWTHDGPYKTLKECDVARKRAETFTTAIYKRRQVAKPCVRVTFEAYIAETRKLR